MEKTRYLVSDDKKIIDYILEMELEWEVKGNQMWKQMQQDMENCRTWQSLKNRYLKYIVPALHLSEYGLDDAGIKRLKDGAKVNSSTKKQANRSVDNSPDRHFYTLEEDKEILEALLKTSLKHLKGNEIWQKMVKDGVCEGRTYESMRNRFLKNIVPDLTKEAYGLSSSDIERIYFSMKIYGTPEENQQLPGEPNTKTWQKSSVKSPLRHYSLMLINSSDEDTE